MWPVASMRRPFETMKLLQFALLFPFVLSSVWAQQARESQAPASQGVTEQRRVELRQTLKAQRAQDLTNSTRNSDTPPRRHLSAQERADLRQQLRQQRP